MWTEGVQGFDTLPNKVPKHHVSSSLPSNSFQMNPNLPFLKQLTFKAYQVLSTFGRWLLLYMEYERQMVATQPSPNGRILVSKIVDITNEDEVWRDHMMGPPASFPYHSYIDTPEEWEVLVTLMGGASNQWKSLQRTLHICQLGTIIAVSGKNGHEWKRVDKCWNHQLG